jgi:hypothetical protein
VRPFLQKNIKKIAKKFAKSGMFNVPLQRLLKKLLLGNYSVTTRRGGAAEP